jgi:hypothetical protein
MTRRRPATDAQREIIRKVRNNPQNSYPMPSDHRRNTVRLLIGKGMLQLTPCGKRFEIKR